MEGGRTGMTTLSLIESHGDRDALSAISSHLDVGSLACLSAVNAFFSTSVTTDRVVWDGLCNSIFKDKVFIPAEATRRRQQGDPRAALRIALTDATRTTLTEEELTNFEWNFRFKEAAGPGWCEEDPYWRGAPGGPAKIRFDPLKRGVHVPTHPAGMSGGVRARGFDMLEERRLRWSWGPHGPLGSHVQIRVDGMRVPTYVVSRHAPNWGWLMQSCWVLYTSFPMPAKGSDPSLEDTAFEMTVETQSREAQAYNTGVALAPHGMHGADSSDDEESGPPGAGMALVHLANGETIALPVWLLQHLELQEGGGGLGEGEGDEESEVDEEDEDETGDEEDDDEEEEEAGATDAAVGSEMLLGAGNLAGDLAAPLLLGAEAEHGGIWQGGEAAGEGEDERADGAQDIS